MQYESSQFIQDMMLIPKGILFIPVVGEIKAEGFTLGKLKRFLAGKIREKLSEFNC